MGCFRTSYNEPSSPSSPSSSSSSPRTPRSPYTWLKCTAHELEIKDRCRNLFARIGNNCMGRKSNPYHYHRRSASVEFRYDPLSYALNFEDELRYSDEFPPMSFSSRLPMSPDRLPQPSPVAGKFGDAPVVSMSRQLLGYS